MARQVISLAPSDYVAGGLLQDIDVEITDIRFVVWNYGGAVADPVLAVRMDLEYGEGENKKTEEQYWSCGSLRDFIPSEDGFSVEQAEGSTKTCLNNNSNWAHCIQRFVALRFPEEKLRPGRLDVMIGTRWHLVRIPAPDREGFTPTPTNKERKFAPTIAVPDHISRLPWEKKDLARGKRPAASATPIRPAGESQAATPANSIPAAPAQTAAPASAPLTSAPPPSPVAVDTPDASITSLALSAVTTAFTNVGNPPQLDNYPGMRRDLFLAMQGAPNDVRTRALALVFDPKWLADNNFILEGATLIRI